MRTSRAVARLIPCLYMGALACSSSSTPAITHARDQRATNPEPIRSMLRSAMPHTAATMVAPQASASPVEHPMVSIREDHMVRVPAGTFMMGCAVGDEVCDEDERPRHRVILSAYWIDVDEVTVSDYRACVAAGQCVVPAFDVESDGPKPYLVCNWHFAERAKHPVNCVDVAAAASYCSWRDKRLPTEAEWERAARGTDARVFPWGNEELPDAACMHRGITCEVGTHPTDTSPVGAQDMAGNVAEWVSDAYHRRYYLSSPPKNPKGFAGSAMSLGESCSPGIPCAIHRGGSFWDEVWGMRTSDRQASIVASEAVGFRCARSDE